MSDSIMDLKSKTIKKDQVNEKLERFGRNRPCTKKLARMCGYPDVEAFNPLNTPEDMQYVVDRLSEYGTLYTNGSGGAFYATCHTSLGSFDVKVHSGTIFVRGSTYINLAVCQLLKNVERCFTNG